MAYSPSPITINANFNRLLSTLNQMSEVQETTTIVALGDSNLLGFGTGEDSSITSLKILNHADKRASVRPHATYYILGQELFHLPKEGDFIVACYVGFPKLAGETDVRNYQENYKKTIETLSKKIAPERIFIALPVRRGKSFQESQARAIKAIQDLCHEKQIPCVDIVKKAPLELRHPTAIYSPNHPGRHFLSNTFKAQLGKHILQAGYAHRRFQQTQASSGASSPPQTADTEERTTETPRQVVDLQDLAQGLSDIEAGEEKDAE